MDSGPLLPLPFCIFEVMIVSNRFKSLVAFIWKPNLRHVSFLLILLISIPARGDIEDYLYLIDMFLLKCINLI